jgi:signal transduction histidine kinase
VTVRRRLGGALSGAPLRTRVMAVAAILVAVTCLVTGLVGTALLRSYLYGRADAQLRDFAVVTRHVLDRPHGPVRPGAQRPALPSQFLVEVVSAAGRVQRAGSPLRAPGGLRLSAAQLRDHGHPFSVPAAGAPGHSWRVLVESLSGGRHGIIAFSLDSLNNTVTRLEIADALAGAIAIVLLAGIGLPLVRASLAPLRRIEATAVAIAGGDLSRRIDHPSPGTEVGRLADALDTMLGRIEAAYQARADGEARALRSEDRMRRFVADASHELRTPLTSVRGLAEYGIQLGSGASPGELLRLITLIQLEAGRMGRLVDDLLALARTDAGTPLDRRQVDLASVAALAVQATLIVNPGRAVTLVAADPVIVCADEERLRQIIDNLISNAVQHTPPQSPITVSVTCTTRTGEIMVADNGPGMTAEQSARVFERFYRTDDSRSRASGGTGLGLAIAAALAAAHGGDITVDSEPGQGSAFRVRLPLAATVDSGT